MAGPQVRGRARRTSNARTQPELLHLRALFQLDRVESEGDMTIVNGFSASEKSEGLELSERDMLRFGSLCIEAAVQHISQLEASVCSRLHQSAEIAASMREPAPDCGQDFAKLLSLLLEDVIPLSINTAHPSYMGYIPGGGIFPSALAEFLAAATNRYVSVWAAAPAMARLEANVTDWFAQWLGYPTAARGILTSGGSMANFSAVVTARRSRLGEDLRQGTMYISDQSHHSIEKAAILAGIPENNIRKIPTGTDCRAVPSDFDTAMRRDVQLGLKPFLLVANGGTTNSGAIDPLKELAGVSKEHGAWFHVDAAYGGFFVLTEPGRHRLEGIELSDSITLDPHKGLFLPYGTGSLVVREGDQLLRAHQLTGDYHRDLSTPEGEMNLTDYSLEQSRSFRGLSVWLPLKMFGTVAFRVALDEKLELATWLYEQLCSEPGFQCGSRPDLSVVTFAYMPESGNADDFNRRLLVAINETGRLFLSGTTIKGRYTIRVCILCFRTHRRHVEAAFELIRSVAQSLDR